MRKRYVYGQNRKGVYLNSADIELLYYLLQSQLLTSQQLLTLYKTMQPSATINTIKSKMARWKKYGVVVGNTYKLGQWGISYNYYRIGARGISILIDNGYLDESWRDKDVSRFSKRRNIEHYLGTQNIVCAAMAEAKVHDISLETFEPYNSFFAPNDTKGILPDWVLKQNETYYCIELDVGTEPLSEIHSKIDRYFKLAKDKPDKTFVILFSILDDSLLTKNNYGSDRSKRIAGLKKILLNHPSCFLDNISIYIKRLESATLFLKELLITKRLSKEEKVNEIKNLLKLTTDINTQYDFKYTEVKNSYDPLIDGDLIINLKHDKRSNVVALLYLEEGNLLDYTKCVLLDAASKSETNGLSKIIGIYKNARELKEDHFGMQLTNTYFMEANNILQFEKLKFFRLVSPFKKEGNLFETI